MPRPRTMSALVPCMFDQLNTRKTLRLDVMDWASQSCSATNIADRNARERVHSPVEVSSPLRGRLDRESFWTPLLLSIMHACPTCIKHRPGSLSLRLVFHAGAHTCSGKCEQGNSPVLSTLPGLAVRPANPATKKGFLRRNIDADAPGRHIWGPRQGGKKIWGRIC